MDMTPLRVYMCDLTHDTVVLVSDTIPINIGFIGSYAKKVHEDAIQLSLFKYPQAVIRAIEDSPPSPMTGLHRSAGTNCASRS